MICANEFFALFWLFRPFFDKNQKFRFLSYLPSDVIFHLSHQPGWSDKRRGRSFNFSEQTFRKKNIFVFWGNPLYRNKFFDFFSYQSIAFIQIKTLIPHWSSLDMCERHSTALKSESAKIRISPKPPLKFYVLSYS